MNPGYESKYYSVRDSLENKHYSDPINLGMNMGMGMNLNMNPAPNMNSHVNPSVNSNGNIVQRLSMLIKSQLPYLQAIMMNVKVPKKEEKHHSR